MKLSKNFTLDEFTFSQTAARLGLDNTPPADVVDNLCRLAALLEEVRTLVKKPIQITSGYRSEKVNLAVGSTAKNSAHLYGLAADIVVPGIAPKKVALLIADSDINFNQLILEYDRWTHFAIAPVLGMPKRELLTIRTGTGYMKGIL